MQRESTLSATQVVHHKSIGPKHRNLLPIRVEGGLHLCPFPNKSPGWPCPLARGDDNRYGRCVQCERSDQMNPPPRRERRTIVVIKHLTNQRKKGSLSHATKHTSFATLRRPEMFPHWNVYGQRSTANATALSTRFTGSAASAPRPATRITRNETGIDSYVSDGL